MRAARRSMDRKKIPNAPVFVENEKVDLWKPTRQKFALSWCAATVCKVAHPTYFVTDIQGNEFKVSVRRLRKVPKDPFGEEDEEDVAVAGDRNDHNSAEECSSDSDSKSDGSLDLVDELPEDQDQELIDSVRENDFVLYKDGGVVFGGKVVKIYTEAVEFHESVFVKKKKRIKAVSTWIDRDGVVIQTNYRPRNADPIIYKIDKSAIVAKCDLDQGSLLPVGADDSFALNVN